MWTWSVSRLQALNLPLSHILYVLFLSQQVYQLYFGEESPTLLDMQIDFWVLWHLVLPR